MKIKIKKTSKEAIIPKHAHAGDAGLDLYSIETTKLNPGEKKIIKTGLIMEIPEGYVGLIWDRSGMAAKHSLHTLAGVIDSNFRGELGIVIINLSQEVKEINTSERIAQILIQPVETIEFQEIDSHSETSRGDGGFGSTGMN